MFIRKTLLAILLASGIVAQLASPSPTTDAAYSDGSGTLASRTGTIEVVLPLGTVIGSVSNVETFNGIPYAHPPLRENGLRLRPPKRLEAPYEPNGQLFATGTAPACPQMTLDAPDLCGLEINTAATANSEDGAYLEAIQGMRLFDVGSDGQEDCLTVSVQRPVGTTSTDKLPVMYYIHGGGFYGGSSQMDASRILRFSSQENKRFILVSVNYRLTGFGFLGGAEVKAAGISNLGLLDQRMGLEWVADNVGAFGGDPDKVTITGLSAGSISVFDQMLLYNGNATYKGKQLFHGAIMNSGSALPAEPIDHPKAQAVYQGVVERANCTTSNNTLDCLREADYEVLRQAINGVPSILSYESLAFAYLPRPDGAVLTESPDVLIENGLYHAVPVIIGNAEDEGTIFARAQKNLTDTAALSSYFHSLYYWNATEAEVTDLVNLYPDDSEYGSPFRTGEAYDRIYGVTPACGVKGFKRTAAMLGDLIFTFPRRFVLERMFRENPSVPVWSYITSTMHNNIHQAVFGQIGTPHGADYLLQFFGYPIEASPTHRRFYLNFLYNQTPNGDGDVGSIGGMPNWPQWKNTPLDLNGTLIHFDYWNVDLWPDNFREASYQYMNKNITKLYY